MTTLGDADFFEQIAQSHLHHSREDPWWVDRNAALEGQRPSLRQELSDTGGVAVGPLGFVSFSYVEMGVINSLDLFGLDELILFSFYWRNRHRYRAVVDMGANVGLHTVLLGRMGVFVTAYEPDPIHVSLLEEHVEMNGIQDFVTVVQAAVVRDAGMTEFIRVVGNTTGSHVAGAKEEPYGELDVFRVRGVGILEAIQGKDFVKMDVEGLEAILLSALRDEHFASLDIACEVGTPENARIIWNHFSDSDVNIFSQKTGWRCVTAIDHMPTSYKEGSIFISKAAEMNWGPH